MDDDEDRLVNPLAAALARTRAQLDRLEVGWAVIGGLALAVRAEPRQTRDVDVAIAVADDAEAERIVRELVASGYRHAEAGVFEQKSQRRLATVRLLAPGAAGAARPVSVDLFFRSSCIEPELVAAADELEVLGGLSLPVASIGHLIALKVLAGRAQDLADVDNLLRVARPEDLDRAKEALRLIEARGCQRDRDLQGALARHLGG